IPAWPHTPSDVRELATIAVTVGVGSDTGFIPERDRVTVFVHELGTGPARLSLKLATFLGGRLVRVRRVIKIFQIIRLSFPVTFEDITMVAASILILARRG